MRVVGKRSTSILITLPANRIYSNWAKDRTDAKKAHQAL